MALRALDAAPVVETRGLGAAQTRRDSPIYTGGVLGAVFGVVQTQDVDLGSIEQRLRAGRACRHGDFPRCAVDVLAHRGEAGGAAVAEIGGISMANLTIRFGRHRQYDIQRGQHIGSAWRFAFDDGLHLHHWIGIRAAGVIHRHHWNTVRRKPIRALHRGAEWEAGKER